MHKGDFASGAPGEASGAGEASEEEASEEEEEEEEQQEQDDADGDDDAPCDLELVSFGHRHGREKGVERVFDVRSAPNPPARARRAHTGLSARIIKEMRHAPEPGAIARELDAQLRARGRPGGGGGAPLRAGIGCEMGEHRSVAIAAIVRGELRERGWRVRLTHRDVHRHDARPPGGGGRRPRRRHERRGGAARGGGAGSRREEAEAAAAEER